MISFKDYVTLFRISPCGNISSVLKTLANANYVTGKGKIILVL